MKVLFKYVALAGALVLAEFILVFFFGVKARITSFAYFGILFAAAVGALFVLVCLDVMRIFPYPFVDEILFAVSYVVIALVLTDQPANYELHLTLMRFFLALILGFAVTFPGERRGII